MNPYRRQRLTVVSFVLGGAAIALTLVLLALEENVNLFYEPARIVNGEAPTGRTIRAGGMVADDSVVHDDTGLGVRFVLTDYRGNDFEVYYNGILPGMFRVGQGTLVTGQLDQDRRFQAREVLAKHDENYLPPELHDVLPDTAAGVAGAVEAGQPMATTARGASANWVAPAPEAKP